MLRFKLFNINSKLYYSQILYEWLNERKQQIKESSYMKYLTTIDTIINPELGHYEFKHLTDKNIYDFFNNDKMINISDSTRRIVFIIINSSINYGVSKKYRKSFNKLNIKIKKPKNKIIYFTKKEQQLLVEYLNNNINLRNLGILLSLYTGIRIGELCALQWKDIDFINKTLSINKTVQRIKNIEKESSKKTTLMVNAPKTEHSIRIIPLPDFLIPILYKFRTVDTNYVFTNSLTPKDPRAFEKYLVSVLKKCEIRNLNFHALRHTFATRSREAGIDIKVLSEILGHSSYHITQEVYVHVSVDFKRDSMDSLIDYLSSQDKFVEL